MPNTPLTDAINALTTYANTVTGASDTTLSDAVATLANGYGQGGADPSDYIDMDITGMTVVYQGEDIEVTGASGSYIDTGIALFSSENINKDFKVILRDFYADVSKGTEAAGYRCILGAMYEVSPYPGIIIRVGANAAAGVISMMDKTEYSAFVISRENGVITTSAMIGNPVYASITNNGTKSITVLNVGSLTEALTTHDTTLTIGCEKDANGNPYRFCSGRVKSITIAMKAE